jgi:hypothetical protein
VPGLVIDWDWFSAANAELFPREAKEAMVAGLSNGDFELPLDFTECLQGLAERLPARLSLELTQDNWQKKTNPSL